MRGREEQIKTEQKETEKKVENRKREVWEVISAWKDNWKKGYMTNIREEEK
jgi:hypothetical protein